MQKKDEQLVKAHLDQLEILFQQLPVSKPYHSSWMDSAIEPFLNLQITSITPRIPIICCAQAKTLEKIKMEDLWRSVREPLLFSKTIEALEKIGPHQYIDVGPSGMLATSLKYILPSDSQSKTYSIISPYKQASKNLALLISQTHSKQPTSAKSQAATNVRT